MWSVRHWLSVHVRASTNHAQVVPMFCAARITERALKFLKHTDPISVCPPLSVALGTSFYGCKKQDLTPPFSRSALRRSAPSCCDHSCSMRTTVPETRSMTISTRTRPTLSSRISNQASIFHPIFARPVCPTFGQSRPHNKRNSTSAIVGYCEGWFKPRKVFSQKSKVCRK